VVGAAGDQGRLIVHERVIVRERAGAKRFADWNSGVIRDA
jgi:hypothetical protein